MCSSCPGSFWVRLPLLLLTALATNPVESKGEPPKFVVTENGSSRCVILVAEDAHPAEQNAAKELQQTIQQVTGAVIPIRDANNTQSEQESPNSNRIFVGQSTELAKAYPELKIDSLGQDGILVRTLSDHDLVLAGSPPRGTLYAVITFLEQIVGVRWWTSTESTLPNQPTLVISDVDIRYEPKLKSRMAYYQDAMRSPFAAHRRLNGHFARLDESWGGHHRFAIFVHSFYPLLPPERYFDDHPEWYSLIDGKRTPHRAQLCLTNEAMRDELTRNSLALLRQNPQANIISISQNDWYGACQCKECQALAQKEGSEAGPLLTFVNAVASEVEKEFPDVWVETLAYQYTRKAPKTVRPRDNVVIRLCSIECSFAEPFAEATGPVGDANTDFRRDIEAWSEIAPRLFVWDYVTNFSNYLVPHPNLHVLASNVRFFVEHNVIGLFEQGDAQSGVGDFLPLRCYLLSHLMWNPDIDAQGLIDEFLDGYYGPAAPHLKSYLDLMSDSAVQSDVFLRCFMPDTASWMTLDVLQRATELFDQAEQAVATHPDLLKRVQRERLAIDHVWLNRYHALQLAARLRGVPIGGPSDPREACERFIENCHRFGVVNWRENVSFDQRADALLAKFGPPATPPNEVRGLDDSRWLDIQDGMFQLHRRGEWTSQVDDPHASDGLAAAMPGTHHEWAVGLPFSKDIAAMGPWRVFVSVRAEGEAVSGDVMTLGIYDAAEKRAVAGRTLHAQAAISPEYQTIDLGTHDLTDAMYFWAAPVLRPGEIKKVYVDRVFLVKAL